MTHLYIDTNAYLSFFHLTSDDLEELKKVHLLMDKAKEITLHLPEQTLDECRRNRELKIADAIRRLKEEKLNNQFPQICKPYVEYSKLRDTINKYEHYKSKLIEKLMFDISNYNLEADKIIASLFKNAKNYTTTDEILLKARNRFDLGKPPGKNKSYGDAINWETLLSNVPDGEDLYFVSEDKDFYSELNLDLFSHYLSREWRDLKKSDIHSFKRMSQFFKAKFPKIKLASDYEKELLINGLVSSGSFSRSRTLLTGLSEFDDFSESQLNDLVLACTTNSQIYWIKDDIDIQEIITKIIKPNRYKIDKNFLQDFDRLYPHAV